MAATLQARLDRKTANMLARLRKLTGLSDSELARRGLESLAKDLDDRGPVLVGIGQYDSGVGDLATNPRYMKGFGE